MLSDENELDEVISKLGLPLVIKPYDFGGSGGVYLAYTKDEALEKLRLSKELINTYKDSFKIKGDKFLIEEFIDNEE
ncbi:ATP-grasp domain-containing protein [Campylobacter avium]|uniref:ATP-grasp domain-containing protein n=1 Tax=Campylobacter avium TaxID=522485 RepID=UPI00255C2536|nr:ATP-grasp domain-containing protein [Campylobacter avium]